MKRGCADGSPSFSSACYNLGMKIALVVYSLTGHTYEMAEEIVNGIAGTGAEARIFNIKDVDVDKDFIDSSSGLIIGTPTYMAGCVWQIRKWLEEDSKSFSLAGKLGGAFATAHYAQGGQDTAIMDILGQLLVKGMLVYSGGGAFGLPIIHHGPVALDKEGDHYERSREMFRIYGSRFASECLKLFS